MIKNKESSASGGSALMAESEPMVFDNTVGPSKAGKSNQNPFQKCRKVTRSPMRARSHSLIDNPRATQKQTADLTPLIQRKDTPSASISEKVGLSSSTKSEEKEIIKLLESQLNAAHKEIKNLKELVATMQYKKNYSPPNSDDEEELVAKETAWLLPKHKKRKCEGSPEKCITTPKAKTSTNVVKTYKPPPVILSNIENYTEISRVLQTKKLNFKANLMNNNQLKINVDSEPAYRDLTKVMSEAKLEWHTYENKQTRPIRVMVRNLHPSCATEDIKNELLNKGFQILEVANKIKKTTENSKEVRISLPLFMLSFHNSEDIKKIFGIQYLCHMRVKIEALRHNKLIPQCKRCQRYGHTQSFCQREPNCVKCAGKHLTSECIKPKNTAPKCINCAEAHPANYRGCQVAKELQKRRNNLNKPKEIQNIQPRTFFSNEVTNGISYAQKAKASHTQHEPLQNEQHTMIQVMQNMIHRLDKFSGRLDRMESQTTGAVARRLNQ